MIKRLPVGKPMDINYINFIRFRMGVRTGSGCPSLLEETVIDVFICQDICETYRFLYVKILV